VTGIVEQLVRLLEAEQARHNGELDLLCDVHFVQALYVELLQKVELRAIARRWNIPT
jgi:hypothetical protein